MSQELSEKIESSLQHLSDVRKLIFELQEKLKQTEDRLEDLDRRWNYNPSYCPDDWVVVAVYRSTGREIWNAFHQAGKWWTQGYAEEIYDVVAWRYLYQKPAWPKGES